MFDSGCSVAGRIFAPRQGRISDKHSEQQLLAAWHMATNYCESFHLQNTSNDEKSV